MQSSAGGVRAVYIDCIFGDVPAKDTEYSRVRHLIVSLSQALSTTQTLQVSTKLTVW